MTIAVGTEVMIKKNLKVNSISSGVYLNREMVKFSGKSTKIRECVGIQNVEYYLLEGNPFLWPTECLTVKGYIPVEIKAGVVVTVVPLTEEVFGEQFRDFMYGYVGSMRTHVGKTYRVREVNIGPDGKVEGVRLETLAGGTVSYSWDVRAVKICTEHYEKAQEFIKKFDKKIHAESVYRFYPQTGTPFICTIDCGSGVQDESSSVTIKPVISTKAASIGMTASDLLNQLEATPPQIKLICLENSR